MIINTGNRTDIPAFYSAWFLNRLQEGVVCARNPYHPTQVSRYALSPEVVDCFLFCTKNPGPMLPHLHWLDAYGQLWFVTITPYGRDVEPGVPPVDVVMTRFRTLSQTVGSHRTVWRYDPILVDETHPPDFHLKAFARMAAALEGFTEVCVISFIDLYEKTRRNFPALRAVPQRVRWQLANAFVRIGAKHGIRIQTCAERDAYAQLGVDTNGCMSQQVIEKAIGAPLSLPAEPPARPQCSCVLGHDIGAYHSCLHGCRYCYATGDHDTVKHIHRQHDPTSPFLIGAAMPQDRITDVPMVSHIIRQQGLFPGE